jgi:hypothetical protein
MDSNSTRFIPNKYYRWYQRICAGWPCAKDRAADYTERHHILTFARKKDSEGGPFDFTNPKARDFSGARARRPEW